MNKEAVIEVRDLRKDYGDYSALKGISFHVDYGEIFALLGTNGAGKTTTMDVLSGFQQATAGTVRVLGADPWTERAKIASRVGIMLQEAGFFEDLTVLQTIEAWRRFTPGARPHAEVLELVDLTRQRATPVGRLSGGEKRRLDLALSLLANPQVLFLDEPSTGLDPEARRNTWDVLKDLSARGTTVLLTTHYMEEAEFLAQRVAIVDRGEVVREGTMADIKSRSNAEISFRLPSPLGAADLPTLPDAEFRVDAGAVHLTTKDPQHTLEALLRWAAVQGVRVSELRVDSGSLEAAFLEVAKNRSAS